ncbi:MAG: flagellar hook-length control protein FliK [Pseudomonadota bacterium]
MEELQLALTSSRVDQRNFGLWINNWQVGQSLNALVTNQLPSGELVLRVGGQQVTATSDIPIQQGAQLLLEVKQLQPVPTLRVLAAPESVVAAAGNNATVRLMPGLGSEAATIPAASLMQSLQTSPGTQAMPAPVAASIDELLRLSTRPERLATPDGLARAVRDSGVFLEAKLAGANDPGRAATARDIKAGVLRTLAQANSALGGIEQATMNAADAESLAELKRELEATLGRLNLNQIASQGSEGQQRSWQLEVPVQYGNAFHTLGIQIERDGGGAEQREANDDEAPWRVKLDLEPGSLGAIELDLRLDETQLRLDIAAARPETRRLLDAALGLLDSALASRGLNLAAGPAREMPADTGNEPVREPRGTLDLRA